MSLKILKIINGIIAAAALAALCTAFVPVCAVKAMTQTKTVDITRPQKDITGEGYYWDNRESILYINGLDINTEDDYGLRLISGTTVEIHGKNTITASKAAIAAQGSLTVTGDGTLTVISDGDGIMSYSTVSSTEIKIRSGILDITAGGRAIRCDAGTISIVGGKMNIAVSDRTEGYAVWGHNVRITGGELLASSVISADRTLLISNALVEASSGSERAVLSAGDGVELQALDILAGSSNDSLAASASYSGESAVRLTSNVDTGGRSFILGDAFPRIADYLLITGGIILLVLIVGLPLLIHHMKTKKLIARLEAEKTSGK